nr:MAG TPA: hypothetical protein [Caudoviricetes sp.]
MIKLNQQIHPASRRSALGWIFDTASRPPTCSAYHAGDDFIW